MLSVAYRPITGQSWVLLWLILLSSCVQRTPDLETSTHAASNSQSPAASPATEYCVVTGSYRIDVVGLCKPAPPARNDLLSLEPSTMLSGPPQKVPCRAELPLLTQACEDSLRTLTWTEKKMCKETFTNLLVDECRRNNRVADKVNCVRSIDEPTRQPLPPICTFQNPNDGAEEQRAWQIRQACVTYADN